MHQEKSGNPGFGRRVERIPANGSIPLGHGTGVVGLLFPVSADQKPTKEFSISASEGNRKTLSDESSISICFFLCVFDN
jgi:hypothetical protein